MDWIIQPRGALGVMRAHASFLTKAGNPSFCPVKGKWANTMCRTWVGEEGFMTVKGTKNKTGWLRKSGLLVYFTFWKTWTHAEKDGLRMTLPGLRGKDRETDMRACAHRHAHTETLTPHFVILYCILRLSRTSREEFLANKAGIWSQICIYLCITSSWHQAHSSDKRSSG